MGMLYEYNEMDRALIEGDIERYKEFKAAAEQSESEDD